MELYNRKIIYLLLIIILLLNFAYCDKMQNISREIPIINEYLVRDDVRLLKTETVNSLYYGYVADNTNVTRLDSIKSRNYIIAGVNYNNPPFSYLDGENLIGFEIDLLEYIANELSVSIKYVEIDNTNRIEKILNREVDIVSNIIHTIERDSLIDFSKSYFIGGYVFLVKQGSNISNIEDLKGRTVSILRDIIEKDNIDRLIHKQINLFRANRIPQDLEAFLYEIVDGIITDVSRIFEFKNKINNPLEYKILPNVLRKKYYAFGVQPNDSNWRDFVNFSLNKSYISGYYDIIYEKYFGKDTIYNYKDGYYKKIW